VRVSVPRIYMQASTPLALLHEALVVMAYAPAAPEEIVPTHWSV